jgi:photosystem II stability/assembly factor-like uncharacterized protein
LAYPYVSSLVFSGTNLFAGTNYGGIFHSTNNGTNWIPVNTGLANTYVTSLAFSDTNLFAGTYGGVFLSTNYGTSWDAVNTDLNLNVLSLAVVGMNLFAGTLAGGVFLSTNNGTSWTEASTGLIGSNVNSIVLFNTNLFAGTDGGVFLSTNNGTNWKVVNSGLPYYDYPRGSGSCPVIAIAFSDKYLLASTSTEGVFRSTDSGTTWAAANSGIPQWASFSALAASDSYFFVGTSQGVFRSTNNGTTWSAVNTGLTDNYGVPPWGRALTASGANLLFSGNGGGLYLSTNYGSSWTTLIPSHQLHAINAIAFSGTNILAGTSGQILLSIDRGKSWTPIHNAGVKSFAVSGTNVFAGGWGVHLSTNNGMNWISIPGFPTDLRINSLVISETNLFAATDNCVWRRPLSEMITSVDRISNNSPEFFSLSQNYPNPFNPSTTIRFKIPKQSNVTIKVFDLLGREVITLVNETLGAGSYKTTWNAEDKSSGVYFYHLKAGEFDEVKKLILLR